MDNSHRHFSKEIAGISNKMVRLYAAAREAGINGSNIYIHGELGSGKDILAEYIHSHSKLEGAFMVLDIAELRTAPRATILKEVSELLLKAERGTIYIKSISLASPTLQNALLSVLSNVNKKNNDSIRIIASSHIDINELADKNRFKRELTLLFPISLDIPPLYERREDIEELITIFLREIDSELSIADDAKDLLLKYRWPGNVRELYNTLLHSRLYADNKVIRISSLPKSVRKKVELSAKSSTLEELYILSKALLESGALNSDIDPYFEYLRIVETEFIKAALDLTSNNKLKAAELMHINRNTLASKLEVYRIDSRKKKSRKEN